MEDKECVPTWRICRSQKEKKGPKSEEEERIELIKSGTFLISYCPHCKKSLIENNSIKLKVDRGDKEGFMMLSPYLNIFTLQVNHQTT